MYILAQIIGVLAVVLFVLSYQFKRRKHIVLANAVSNCLYVLQYILLGALEGAAIDMLSSVSAVAANGKDKGFVAKHVKTIFITLNLAILAAGLCLYKNIFSLFPIVGAILQTSAFWVTEERKIRLVSLLGAPFWLIYNLVSMAYGSTIGNALSIISLAVAIYRYDIYPKIKRRNLK